MMESDSARDREDRERIAAFYRQGDDESFQPIMDRWEKPLLKFFRRRDPRSPTEDLCQETFIRLFVTREVHQSRYDERRGVRFGAWFYQIAFRVYIDWRRKSERQPPLVDTSTEAGDEVEEEGSPDPDIERLPERLVLEQCIARLPEQQRAYLCLCGEHGLGQLSHTEIARLFGVSPARVTAISRQALAALRTYWESEQAGE